MYRQVTVYVPDARMEEFYIRFGDFMGGGPSPSSEGENPPARHQAGQPPAWTREQGAEERAAAFWHDVTDPGRDVLRVLIAGAEEEPPRHFLPADVVAAVGAKSTQAIAGILGGVGQVVSGHDLPSYDYEPGRAWHFVWDWDPKKRLYSMAPEMAALLRMVGA
ncbi:hypothetical protein [Curtobacterium sp. MCBD17_040]|uniref:hypothetical protein n=1 Tax=Curtobacterium sp. MCBD17_040 TaxID=2175674 RepID=UPI000DA8EA53|nr:hypothetical protein [Curtobacterium sp. MCBD17_040]WIB65609.1 hypothetical protein DEI94_15940 [Curtobacterium sp. MCBD17_040]